MKFTSLLLLIFVVISVVTTTQGRECGSNLKPEKLGKYLSLERTCLIRREMSTWIDGGMPNQNFFQIRYLKSGRS